VNCGAGVDILEMLDRPTDKVFFVLDSHRPIHVANYYDETNQVCNFFYVFDNENIESNCNYP